MSDLVDYNFGPDSRNRLAETSRRSADGAIAALETFYYALNNADLDVLAEIWSDDDLAQVDNPVGGIVRSGRAVVDMYRHLFDSGVQLDITFTDAATYWSPDAAMFAGREVGHYTNAEGEHVPLEFRTSRYFTWHPRHERWRQLHHHGSMDDPSALHDYQQAALR
ncbi:YybH family protein [Dactylosporangium fulvum]|uniref:Nuclear transport factor 2 family protein n=1 Tax=Dactylosporangium fulvum TaxID=53359 RepID=A0ABY5VQZ2_9ACTN|nr:nuclear transport factor 2 family protein [Dactylosporangium fulvum]UWP79504.1 nuclear transport factor 2 family protein [Dactylosporangium fulvum]